MLVAHLSLRDFRSYEAAELRLGATLTVVQGPNGAGKTNLLEALYMGCTGRSCRTQTDREVVRFGAGAARVELTARGADGDHLIRVLVEPGAGRQVRIDGLAAERLADVEARPLVGRLPARPARARQGPAGTAPRPRRPGGGGPVARAGRDAARVHARAGSAQRPSGTCPGRRGGRGRVARVGPRAGDPRCGPERRPCGGDRRAAPRYGALAADLGLDGDAALAYRPRTRAETAEALAAELRERLPADLERGFTTHGPHRDDLVLSREGRALRAYGSQGQQRLALLALLLAERDAIAATRGAPPLMLLDDVMSELDGERRERLVALLTAAPAGRA